MRKPFRAKPSPNFANTTKTETENNQAMSSGIVRKKILQNWTSKHYSKRNGSCERNTLHLELEITQRLDENILELLKKEEDIIREIEDADRPISNLRKNGPCEGGKSSLFRGLY